LCERSGLDHRASPSIAAAHCGRAVIRLNRSVTVH